jgi:hypothetical protein
MTINPTIPTVGSPRGSEEIDVVNALTAIVDAVNAGTGPAVVASLPLAPVDGQEIYYLASAASGVVWHLKYRAASASAYKWEFVGGGPLSSYVFDPGSVTTDPVAFNRVILATGPTVIAPLAGDYVVEATISARTTAVAHNDYRAHIMNGVTAVATALGSSYASSAWHNLSLRSRDTYAASASIRLGYSASVVSLGLAFLESSLFVRPVRVG